MKIREEHIEQVVLGSGAAGFQAALRLWEGGERSLALVTENLQAGTSRNTGSDKQTYYKLSLAGQDADSVRAMSEDLFAGQCVDGDQALCEAALSSRAFYRLAELGVPFPYTEYGEFMGYKTDHDRGRRATSAGPYTSRMMTECLERRAKEEGVPILDQLQAIRLLVKDGCIRGVLCLDRNAAKAREAAGQARAQSNCPVFEEDGQHSAPQARMAEEEAPLYRLIWCDKLILATGGPAGMYRDSVYPASQTGSSGLAFEAGVPGKNLTEWQFGLASLRPRWNVSGTYMQALPRFVSTDAEGGDAREFLAEYFPTPEALYSMVFLKGYQWPFDVNKIFGGSSVIDLLVYQETVLRGRRVFLDFTRNAGDGAAPAFARLIPEAYDYLKQAGALLSTPIERLRQMNEPAISFYREHGVDLSREWLEIAVCAQHNNGGLATDAHWETAIGGLYAVGEVCGSHGVTRPGGTALNAGQVGAMRAAEDILLKKRGAWRQDAELYRSALRQEAEDWIAAQEAAGGTRPLSALWREAATRMSGSAGMIRNENRLRSALAETNRLLSNFTDIAQKPQPSQLPLFYKLREMLISQKVYISAMLDYSTCGAGSRGSALYTDETGELPYAFGTVSKSAVVGDKNERKREPNAAGTCAFLDRDKNEHGCQSESAPCEETPAQNALFPELFRCRLDQGGHGGVIQEARLAQDNVKLRWRPVRPLPDTDYFFENQWRRYRERFGLM